MLNSIGLENPGCDAFEREILPWLRERGLVVVASFAGERPDDFRRAAARLDGLQGLAALEINLSCPNVEKGGLDIGTDPDAIRRIVGEVRGETALPLLAKLTPNVTDIRDLAQAAESGGADGLSVINTLAAMAIDWRRRCSRLGTSGGGLSGPAIKPVALRMVWRASQAVSIPVVGIGGIRSGEDVLEFLVAGATAVQVGTANFLNPSICGRIVEDLRRLLAEEGIGSVRELIGTFRDGAAAAPVRT
jgi:dihydroorotate dehydrogenase (NAD+) catalytic subunit